jgi:undecaprenyl pyrophosphate phosphatase UppP
MDLSTAAIFGIVEGVSEFLPISSTGHLILVSQFMGLEHTDFLKSFEIAIQVGAILSVLVLYWRGGNALKSQPFGTYETEIKVKGIVVEDMKRDAL